MTLQGTRLLLASIPLPKFTYGVAGSQRIAPASGAADRQIRGESAHDGDRDLSLAHEANIMSERDERLKHSSLKGGSTSVTQENLTSG